MKKRLLSFVAMIVAALLLCSTMTVMAEPVSDEGSTIRVGVTNAPTSLDMMLTPSGVAFQLIFEGLFDIDPVSGEVVPWLAESYEWIDDCTIRIKLHDDVYFSNGDKLTPEDVIYSYKRHVDGGSKVASNYEIYDFEKCYAEDDLTVVLTTYEPNASLLLNMSKYPDIVSKAYYEALPDEDLWDHACGTGPYTLVENVSGSHYTLTRRDDYWKTLPDVETFIVQYFAELSTMVIEFENGALDMVIGLDQSSINLLQEDADAGADINVVLEPTYAVDYVVLPEYVEVLQNDNVRKAIAIGVDWAVVADNAYGQLAQVATSVLPSSMTNYYKNEGTYEYDPEAAKQLLADAGYASGDIVINALAASTPESVRMYETIQFYLDQIGITLNFTAQEMSSVMPSVAMGETDLFVLLCLSTSAVPDPTMVLEHAHKNAMLAACRISDETYNSYYSAFLNSNDDTVRKEAMNNVQDWLHETCWLLPICERTFAYAYNSNIAAVHITSELNPELHFTELPDTQ